jgi:putative endonuclease
LIGLGYQRYDHRGTSDKTEQNGSFSATLAGSNLIISHHDMPSKTQHKGSVGEHLVAKWLQEKGYLLLQSNYRYLKAEIDLIMIQPPQRGGPVGDLVFIEVKWRRHADFAPPEAAVTLAKQRRLIQAAAAFMRERGLEASCCQFDVIALTGEGASLSIEHYESAFLG